MTRTRYAIAALLQSFGVLRKTKRLTDAAYEMHLLQDGEEILGAFCWPEIEEIEDLSMEYWNLRKLEREEAKIVKEMEVAKKTLTVAQTRRSELLDRTKGMSQELVQEREALFEQVENLNVKRDEIIAEAQQTRRKHAALKMKAKVLKEEDSDNEEQLSKCRKDLAELRETFSKGKERLEEIESKIGKLEDKLAGLQANIDAKVEGSKGEATEAFSLMSKANQDITKFQAQRGLLREEQAALYREVGRFLNVNSDRPDVRKACRAQRGLLEQTRLLYRSVVLNRKLVERVTN